MSEYSAKTLREKMKAKARNLAKPGNYVKDQEVSSADWSPAEPLEADVKTGMRPISRRAYKKGGKVAMMEGSCGAARSDRPARKAGGKVSSEIGVGMANKNMKEANEEREGKKHIGGLKHGGKAKRASGGSIPSAAETEDTKARLGSMKIKPVRGAAQHYKKGGKAEGGSLLKKMTGAKSEAEKQAESMRDVGKMGTANYTQEQKGALDRALRGDDSLPEPNEAAERSGKYQNYKKGGKAKWIQSAIKKPGALHKELGVPAGEKIPAKKLHAAAEKGGKLGKRARLAETLGRLGKAAGGALDIGSMKKPSHKSGKSGKTDINITIVAGGKPPMGDQPIAGAPKLPAVGVPTPPPMPMGGPMAPPMPAPAAPPPAGLPMGRKAGGRISKVAKTYKDMEAGAGSGEGRLQKTDIAKRHADAPARKEGGRISKVAKSYKDMTAGAGSGEGRLQKEDIAKAKKARRA